MARKSQLPFDRAMACKFVVVLNPAEQKAVDEFRFQNRIEFKEGAYRELVLRGLQSAGFTPQELARVERANALAFLPRFA